MISKTQFLTFLLLGILHQSFSQSNEQSSDINSPHKYRLSFPVIILSNLGQGGERTNTQHIELHFKYEMDSKNIFGVKFATWRLFQPMGIQWWDGLLDKIESQSEFYPGYLREAGIGISYQRMLWKGLFATVEVLPLVKSYLDLNESKIENGFKLYTSFHIGYHIPLFKNKRIFIEPQIHCQTWLIDSTAPSEFNELDKKWKKYFLFEPNLYLGLKF